MVWQKNDQNVSTLKRLITGLALLLFFVLSVVAAWYLAMKSSVTIAPEVTEPALISKPRISGADHSKMAPEPKPVEASTEQTARFVKVSSDGQILEDSAQEWACVLDTQTQLLWEVKTDDGSWRDAEYTYSWYALDEDGNENGKPNRGQCLYVDCDTYSFVTALSGQGLCGTQDWRLPLQTELQSLDHVSAFNPDIDLGYFPHTQSSQYWSASGNPFSENLAWSVDFANGISYVSEKRLKYHLRLVSTANDWKLN